MVGSGVMILGAVAVSTAIATEREHGSIQKSVIRECNRYGLDYGRVSRAYSGEGDSTGTGRAWWDYVIVLGAAAIFIWLGRMARIPKLTMNYAWVTALSALLVLTVVVCAWGLWKQTRFS
jgi:hypothetical protein